MVRCRASVAALTRRQMILGTSTAAIAATLGVSTKMGRAASAMPRLVADRRTLEVNGKAAPVLGLSGDAVSARFMRGQHFALTLENRLAEPTLVHWHGLTPPGNQDGMPGLSQPPLPPGQHEAYDFPLARAGTYWMHSHVGFQRARLMAAPLIIADPAEAGRDEQEVVIFLADFSFRAPEEILAGLTRGQGGMAAMDHGGKMGAMKAMDHGDAMKPGAMASMDRSSMAQSAMVMPMDLNDIDFDAYLANDRTLADPQVVRVEPSGRIRLRIINGSSATNFWIDLGALPGELIAVDGDGVMPVTGNRFPLAMAQRLDLLLTLPPGQGAFPILALREGAAERTGIVLATAGANVAKLALAGAKPTPALDPALENRLVSAVPLAPRAPDRTLTADLTGDMEGYSWGINGKRYGEDTPFKVRRGERVEIVMRNRTMMAHPMHLHGHRFQVVAINGHRRAGARRDTVLVPAMGSVIIAFDADNPGKWAFHCHNEYHMMSGMMTSVQYEA